MSLKPIAEGEVLQPEVGRYDRIKVAVGYSKKMRAYYVRLSDVADQHNAVFVTEKSDAGYLKLASAKEFLASLHIVLDCNGMYLDGDEEELAKVVADLVLQLMERLKNADTQENTQ
jgi:hypothetical protein